MAKANTKKIITTHPRSRRKMKMDAAIYEPFKSAILQCLKGSRGKTFTELTNEVEKIIRRKIPGFNKSIPWYTISVRLDLETKEIVETFTEKARPDDPVGRGKKLNRLKK
ncbi:MAG TPA: hypothetical protein VI548_04215 [Chitinophagaceae bacterium]|nr:hypothetical protein [Chitinophagaceae bacterium]